MKISIDTKEDSPEEIRKLIRMLSALVGDSYSEKSAPATGEGLFDMFGSPESSTAEQQQMAGNSGTNSGGMDINEFLDKSEQKPGDDDIKVIPY